ncbi:GRIP and coiled-coil domain-containing protein 1-like [Corticium candelabrum]|uniref:GRIP and coiled-coil domain-containing protein 1-like n=1 Tax=Corticium candelabrum TaxID=121492 RepID=UPI002E25D16A|nr:GRIP and coiled-coil domain-containing protein 1-like [Corticium candelabrum]XP_062513202.1 GRIP and coiled-coil domain-containing protein 1-like [Corticium candelabrum]
MDRRPTVAELLATIENQQEQLSRFETRFRDVVKAYKGLLKEKEALEASLHALSTRPSSQTSKLDASEEEHETEQFEEDDESETECESERSKEGSSDALATLTAALSTMTEEKNRMEASFQADKRKLKAEYEAAVLQATTEKKTVEISFKQATSEVETLKFHLRQQQQEREAEQTDHAAMLRELQQVVAKERQVKDDLEGQVQDLHVTLKKAKEVPIKHEVYEKRIKTLSDELHETRKRLRAAEVSVARPSPLMLQFQKEMADMKAQHAQCLLIEQQRAIDAEQRSKATRGMDESRVAVLEDRLSELSTVIGSYERTRADDEATILQLKDRVAHLTAENNNLMQQSKEVTTSHDAQLQELHDEIAQLKKRLAATNVATAHKVQNHVLEDVQKGSNTEFELEKLRQEFDRYKQTVEATMQPRVADDSERLGLQDLSRQKDSLSQDLAEARSVLQKKESAYRKEIQELIEERHQLQEKYKESISAAEMHYQERLAELQLSVQNTRERTKALLSDKEAELIEMRSRLLRRSTSYIEDIEPELMSPNDQSPMKVMSYSELLKEKIKLGPGAAQRQGDTDAAVRQLLSLPAVGSKADAALLHYAEQQSKRESEIKTMRQERLELEQSLREAREREERHADQLVLLKEEIRKLERDRSRETANLEYLKNIVFRFMKSDSRSPGFRQMTSAIMTILKFSPKEVEEVNKFHSSWWYSAS